MRFIHSKALCWHNRIKGFSENPCSRKAIIKVKEVGEIVELETMYIGSEKLLVHLDINVQAPAQEDLQRTVEKIKEHVRKEVPIVYSIQIETTRLGRRSPTKS